jgi:hypothetical protein
LRRNNDPCQHGLIVKEAGTSSDKGGQSYRHQQDKCSDEAASKTWFVQNPYSTVRAVAHSGRYVARSVGPALKRPGHHEVGQYWREEVESRRYR